MQVVTRNWIKWLTCQSVLATAFGADALAGPQQETFGPSSWWLPQNVFPAADSISLLFYIILWLTTVICVAVFVVMGIFLVRYRYQPGRRSRFVHGNVRLEAVWTLIPTVILALIAAFSQSTWSNIKRFPVVSDGEAVIEMEVVAKQFAWYFHYPGSDGILGERRPDQVDLNASEPELIIGLDRSMPGCRDDIVSTVMVVPVNTKVKIKLNSVDVLHSFFLPNFRIKQDTVPGLNTQTWIESIHTSGQVIGTSEDQPASFGHAKPFDIACAELCGQGHFTMRGKLYVVTQEQYEAFLEEEASYLDLGDQDEEEDY